MFKLHKFFFVFVLFCCSQISFAATPSAPRDLEHPSTNTTGSFRVDWEGRGSSERFELQQRKDSGAYVTVYSGSSERYTTSGLTNGSYRYRVRACNGSSCSGYNVSSSYTNVTIAPVTPSVPSSIWSESPSATGSVEVDWGSSTGSVDVYELYQSKDGGSWTLAYTGTSLIKTLTGLTTGSYQFRVRACYRGSSPHLCGGYATTSSPSLVAITPDPPRDVDSPFQDQDGAFTVSWEERSSTQTYQVQQSKNSGAWSDVATVTGLSVSVLGLTDGTYTYRVRACNSAGTYTRCSGYTTSTSDTVVVIPPGIPATISSPSTDSDGAFAVSWGTSTGPVDVYELERQIDGGNWTQIYSGAATSFAMNGRADGSYSFRVRAKNSESNQAAYSTYRTAGVTLVANVPGVPVSITAPATDNNGAFTVSWGGASGAVDAYHLEQQFNGGGWSQVYTGAATSFAVSGLGDGTYSFRVRGRNSTSTFTVYSAYRSAGSTLVANTPGVPVSISAPASDSNGAYSVSWGAASGSVDQYQLYQQKDSAGWVSIYSGSALTKAVSGLSDGSYLYRVRACNTVSTYTACGNFRTSATPTVVLNDTDGDGVPDVTDVFPTDASEWADSDGDGVGDNADAFPNDASETVDTDNDGVGDNADVFPTDPNETIDTDADGIGDNADAYPDDPTQGLGGALNTPLPAASMPTLASIGYDGSTLTATSEGIFRVDESGSATYSMNIYTPAGTAGVAPQVGLNYSSQAGNGLLGKGWSLSGLSSISRCRQTRHQDNNPMPITFSDDDRFCLDGQRLVRISGTEGAADSVYKTEIDSFAKITMKGGSVGHPDYFVVERKDGSTSYYGNTPDSKSAGDSSSVSTTTLSWVINRFEDSVGNPIHFSYHNDVDGHRIAEIRYAYGSAGPSVGPAGYGARLIFDYGDRGNVAGENDNIAGYVAGYFFEAAKRLTKISVNNNGELLREYILNYHQNPVGALNTLSRIDSIQEVACSNAGTNCQALPPTQFSWLAPDEPTVFTHTYKWRGQEYPYNTVVTGFGFDAVSSSIQLEYQDDRMVSDYTFADINGDGLADIIWTEPDLDNGKIHDTFARYALSNGSGFNDPITFYSDSANHYTYYKLHVLDYNADGRMDILLQRQAHDNLLVYTSRPQADGSWRLDSSSDDLGFTVDDIKVLDLDGDGLTDILYRRGTNFYRRYLKNDPAKNIDSSNYYAFEAEEPVAFTAISSADPYNYGAPYQGTLATERFSEGSGVGDFNGDGRVDVIMGAGVGDYNDIFPTDDRIHRIMVATDNGFEEYLSGGDSPLKDYTGGINGVPDAVSAVDINADGLTDLLVRAGYNWYYSINNGAGFEPHELVVTLTLANQNSFKSYDYNQDGYQDLVWHDISASKLKVRLWQPATGGLAPVVDIQNSSGIGSDAYLFSDMNGDAVADLVRFSASNLTIAPGKGANEPRFVIGKITSGLGAETDITYGALSTSGHYSRVDTKLSSTTSEYCAYLPSGSASDWCYEFLVADSSAFYSALNGGWDLPSGSQTLGKTAPVLELMAPAYVVNSVSSSAPKAGATPTNVISSAKSTVSYYYGESKIQASGRGLLGFESLKTVDEQTGIQTITHYRQDFPFIGFPSITEVRTASDELLSRSTNVWELQGWDGSSAIGAPYRPYLASSVEESNATTTIANSSDVLVGGLLAKTTTTNTYDEYGNVEYISITNEDSVGTTVATKTTTNVYGTGPADIYGLEKGRLSSSTVSSSRPGKTTLTRTSAFTYLSEAQGGLLETETIAPGDADNEVTTTYTYSPEGNRLTKAQVGADGSERYTRWEYTGNQARYVSAKYQRFPNPTGGVIERKVEEVVGARHQSGAPIQMRDANGVTKTFEYDALGTTILEYSSTGAWKASWLEACDTACPDGAVFRSVSKQADGGDSVSYYDVLGRVIRQSQRHFDGQYRSALTEYDSVGRAVHQSEPFITASPESNITSYWSESSFDFLGRVTSVTLPDNNKVTTEYDGLVTTVTNQKLQMNVKTNNTLGELVGVTDAAGGTIVYSYDVHGNLVDTSVNGSVLATGITGPVTTSLSYDTLGRKTDMTDPDKGYWQYEHTSFGELKRQIDGKGQESILQYDVMGRLIERTDKLADGTIEHHTVWHYDTAQLGTTGNVAIGLLAKVEDTVTGYEQIYSYDNYGRELSRSTKLNGGTDGTYHEATSYDHYGRVFQQIDASGPYNGTQNVYNDFGYLETILEANTVGVQDELSKILSMNARGQVTGKRLTNGYTTNNYYDAATGRLDEQITGLPGYGAVQHLVYEYDVLGNIEWREDTGLLQDRVTLKALREDFEYDDLNRLTRSQVQDGGVLHAAQVIAYDSLGNITSKTGVGSYSYGAGNTGPHAVTNAGGVIYQYDANGNNVSGDGRTLDYSSFDKVTQIVKGSDQVNFEYDANRSRYKRIDKKNNAVVSTTYYLGAVEKIVKADGSYDLKRYSPGSHLWIYHYDSNGNLTGLEKQTLLKDHLGSINIILDNKNNIDQLLGFDAWGQRVNVASWVPLGTSLPNFDSGLTRRGFTGHEHVDSMGLIHMNGRIYDARLGRFLQADPVIQAPSNTQNYNRYTYVLNNPLVYSDPSGFNFFKEVFDDFLGVTENPVLNSVVQIGLCVVTGPYCPGAVAAYSAATTYAATGDWGAALKNGAIAGVSALAFQQIGAHFAEASAANQLGIEATIYEFGGNWLTAPQIAGQIAAHAAVGGITAELQGGKFGHGFISAGFTKGVMGAAGFDYNNDSNSAIAGRTVVAAVVGGTASKLSGGKFANGAKTAAMAHLLNAEGYFANALSDLELWMGQNVPRLQKARTLMYKDAGPGMNNEGDALRHALGTKNITEELDPLTAYYVGLGHEVVNVVNDQPMNQFWMDMYNNLKGIYHGVTSTPVDKSGLMVIDQKNGDLGYAD